MTQEEQPPPTIHETIQEVLTLLKQQLTEPDYNLINRRGWNLGWINNIYTTEILEDGYYDPQAIVLAIKVLQDILETHTEEEG